MFIVYKSEIYKYYKKMHMPHHFGRYKTRWFNFEHSFQVKKLKSEQGKLDLKQSKKKYKSIMKMWKLIASAVNIAAVTFLGAKEVFQKDEVKTVQIQVPVPKTMENSEIYIVGGTIALLIVAFVMIFNCFAMVYLRMKRNNRAVYTHRALTAWKSR